MSIPSHFKGKKNKFQYFKSLGFARVTVSLRDMKNAVPSEEAN